ncbi:hypothetical protein BDV06DRAFT_202370 [Aspergillus oleicola]
MHLWWGLHGLMLNSSRGADVSQPDSSRSGDERHAISHRLLQQEWRSKAARPQLGLRHCWWLMPASILTALASM